MHYSVAKMHLNGRRGGSRVKDQMHLQPGYNKMTRKVKKILEDKKCKGCELLFKPKRWWQEFHSVKCRNNYWSEYYSLHGVDTKKELKGP